MSETMRHLPVEVRDKMLAGDTVKAVIHKNETIDYLDENDTLIVSVAMDTVYEKGSIFYDSLLKDAVN